MRKFLLFLIIPLLLGTALISCEPMDEEEIKEMEEQQQEQEMEQGNEL